MPFTRPTLADLITRIKGDIRGRLEISGSLLRRAMADVLGTVWAGAVHSLYGYLDWLSKQIFGDTAESAQLLRMAALYGLTPTAATYATGNVTATGTNGTVIPVGTILRLDSVTSYSVTTAQTIASGTATLSVQAVFAGAAANVPAATALTFESPIDGVSISATVATGGIAGGADEETTDAFRARYLLRLQEPPEGGADQDYEAWALAVAGVASSVTRAWVYPNELGLGTVVVRFVEDGNASSIFPNSTDVATVQAALNAERPIAAVVTAEAPTQLAVAFSIHLVPSNATTQAAVTAELTDLFKRVAEPGDGAGRGTVLLSAIRTAIGIAAGVADYSMTAPAADVVPAVGQLATLGTITWT